MSEYQPKKSIDQAWEEAKARENAAAQDSAKSIFSSYSENKIMKKPNGFLNNLQGYILIALVGLVVVILAWNVFKSPPKYTYKVLSVQAQFNAGITQKNTAEIVSTFVNIKDEDLGVLGNEGWELVGTFLEVETTHPNYGNSEYVTGLQPNVRPQRAVMIFKKQL